MQKGKQYEEVKILTPFLSSSAFWREIFEKLLLQFDR